VVILIKLAVRNSALELVRLCMPVSAVGKNRICKIMFVVRHGNEIHGMKNKSTWNNTRKMMTGFMCISKINL
jgi:hypothetical protein